MSFNWKLFPHTDFNKVNLDWIIDCLKALVGGATNQILAKKSNEDFDFVWIDNTGGSGGTKDYNALTNKPSINGSALQGNKTAAQLGLVAAEVGKQLSTNDYTNADKEKLDSIVFVTQSSTFAEVDTAYTAGKKVIFVSEGELFDVVEKPNNTTYRFVHVNSIGGVRTAVITSGGSWTLSTLANPGSYIKYIAQTLSAAQQAQARANIGAYVKPSAGIPKTDLAAAVRASLDKADTALQSAPVTSVNGQTGDIVITAPVTRVNGKTGAVSLGAGDVGAIALKYVDVQVTSDQYAQVGNSSGYAQARILKVLSLDYRYEARLQYSGTTRVYTTGSSQAWATNVTFNIRYVIMDGDFPT